MDNKDKIVFDIINNLYKYISSYEAADKEKGIQET